MPSSKILKLICAFVLLVNTVLIGSISQFNNQRKPASSAVLGVSTSIPEFNQNYVLANSTFSSTRVFNSEESIQNYLVRTNSPLQNYYDSGKLASYWIWNASRGITSSKYGVVPQLNPALILAFLEKEQSLLSYSNYDTIEDPQNRIKTAMGYGCPDDANCDTQYFGFANQVNWGAYQLQYNYDRAYVSSTRTPYRAGNTITTLDGYDVFLSNEATASVYNYTPHVYWGNYNLWKILTGYGWGVSSQTYDLSDIDRVNLYQENRTVTDQDVISYDQVKDILQQDYVIGQSGDDISLLQRYLQQEGYYTYLFITGYYGTITDTAFGLYKESVRENNVPEPEPVVREPATPDFSCEDLYTQSWSIGQSGDDVRTLQECLRASGFFTYSFSTGYFGSITQTALQEYLDSITPQSSSVCESLKNKAWTYGTISEEVRQLQVCMQEAGVFTWPYITTYFGPVTNESLNVWRGTTPPVFECQDLKNQIWREGEVSERVRQLQACMRSAGLFSWPAGNTGYFGAATKSSLISWRGYF